MSDGRKIIMMPGSTYNEHVDQQVFFQGAVHVHNGAAPHDGTPPQEQWVQPVDALPAEMAEAFPLSLMDGAIFHSSVDMDRLKARIRDLGIAPAERNKWCVVYLVLKETAVIASDATEGEFLQWARDVYGATSADFKHCLDGCKGTPTERWSPSIVRPEYIVLAAEVRAVALSHESILLRDGSGNPLHLDPSLRWNKRN